MNKFPYYNHFAVKIILNSGVIPDRAYVQDLSTNIIKDLDLKVVHESDYEFTRHGLTKVWILSQSHLIIHTWPEYSSIHIDLMTCGDLVSKNKLDKIFSNIATKDIVISELIY